MFCKYCVHHRLFRFLSWFLERDNVIHSCAEENRACEELRCPYGIQRSVNSNNCEFCTCFDPCADFRCHEGSSCGIDLRRDEETGRTVFIGECRLGKYIAYGT